MQDKSVAARIEQVVSDLLKHSDFLDKHRVLLQQRLPIACKELSYEGARPPQSEIRLMYKRRRSQNAYLAVLDLDPLLFFPFIIAVAPTPARDVDLGKLKEQVYQQNNIRLRPKAKEFLIETAKCHSFSDNQSFKKLITAHFPPVSYQSAPTTPAEGNDESLYHAFGCTDLGAICDVFGNDRTHALHFTGASDIGAQELQCIQLLIPSQQSTKDALLFLNIENAIDLARILFPQTKHTTFPIPSVEPRNTGRADNNPLQAHEFVDRGYFTLGGGSVVAIATVFGPGIEMGIAECEARMWEKDCFLVDTTDCVTMTVSRAEPRYGMVRLRISYMYAVTIANILFK